MPPDQVSLRPCSPARLGRCLALLCALFWTALPAAEDSPRRRFDIPAGSAVVTLKRAAQQGGLEIVYPSAVVEGFQTQPVVGEFTPREALERMVAHTALRIFTDPQTGALSILRASEPEPPPPPPPPPPQEPPRPMKPKTLITVLSGWLALASSPAQSAHAAAGSTSTAQASASISGRVQNVGTGQFLNNARVTVRGTGLEVFTDQTGVYRLPQVPAGKVVLEVFYTGLDTKSIPLDLVAGQPAVKDFDLTSATRYGEGGVLKLDAFTVATERDTDAHSIAINEQRFAPNLKNVVSADAFGDVTDGNVGEFLKFLPGISSATDSDSAGTVTTVSIRGFGDNTTRVSSDGAQIANTGGNNGTGREFYFSQLTTNNVARVEVTKSPTPANPADTLSGSVNVVSKSAFERKEAEFNYSLSLSASSRSLHLSRQPVAGDRMIYNILPGVTFDYTLPVNRSFGIVVTGQSMDRYVDSMANTRTYSTAAAAGASNRNPFLQDIRFNEGPRLSNRRSLGIRADWRVMTNAVLTFGVQTSSYLNERSTVNTVINASATATPAVAGGKPLTFGPDFTSGATGRGSLTMLSAADFQMPNRTQAGNLQYRFDNGHWMVDARADYSRAIGAYRDSNASPPRFRNMNVTFAVPIRVEFRDMGGVGPRSIRLFDNNEREVSMFDIGNYRLSTATQNNRDYSDEFAGAKFDVRRRLQLFAFPVAVQAGGSTRTQTRDVRHYQRVWNYNGPADLTYLTHTRFGTKDDARFRDFPWLSVAKAWSAFEADPRLFTQTPAQVVASKSLELTNSQYLEESVDAFYAQAEIQPFKRLSVLAGVRREETTVDALGPLIDPTAVWVRTADGSYARSANGARIRKSEAGAVGSLEELLLVRKERGFRGNRNYTGYYPSVHATYTIGQNLIARASFAETYGRPDFNEIIPNTTINELDANNDPNLLDGRISIRNPGLKPWSAKNYDVSLEYYTSQGGLFSIGVFRKNVDGFFFDSTRLATAQDLGELGLDPQYLGWEIVTRANGGASRTDGIEFNLQHSLQALGAWGRPFHAFVNGTKLKLYGEQRANFAGFTPESLNWGINFNHRRFKVVARWNYVGERFRALVAALGPNGAQYNPRRTTMDLNLDFRLRPRLSVFANFNNVFGATDSLVRYGDDTPAYARRTQDIDSGTLLTVGVKGSF
jgi:iron complex outermembrane receptor protein